MNEIPKIDISGICFATFYQEACQKIYDLMVIGWVKLNEI